MSQTTSNYLTINLIGIIFVIIFYMTAKIILFEYSPEELRQLIKDSCREVLQESNIRLPGDDRQVDGYLDADQACEFLGIRKPTLYAQLKSIPHYKPSRKLMFKREELEEYIARHKVCLPPSSGNVKLEKSKPFKSKYYVCGR